MHMHVALFVAVPLMFWLLVMDGVACWLLLRSIEGWSQG